GGGFWTVEGRPEETWEGTERWPRRWHSGEPGARPQNRRILRMNGKMITPAAAALLLATTAFGYAQTPSQNSAPGQRMQDRGSAPGQPGASGYASGQQMQQKGSKSGEPGASGFAPGRQNQGTTGQGGSMGDRDPDRDRGDAR